MFCWNERWKPLMSATMPITVPTPMTIPSSASIERMRFAVSARRAMSNVSESRKRVFMGSLVTQRFDGIEARGAGRRVGAEEHAHGGAHDDPEQHRGEAQRRGQRTHRPHDQGGRGPEQDPDDPAGER